MPRGNRAYEAGGTNTAQLSRSRIDPSMFLQEQGGDGLGEQMAMALKLLGLGEERERRRGESEFGREQLQELYARHRGQRELEEKKLASEERRTAEQQAFNNWAKERQIEQDTLTTKNRQDEIAAALQKSQDEFNIKAYELAAPEERPYYLKNMSDAGRRTVLELEGLKQNAAAKGLLPLVRTAYEKGDSALVKQLTENVAPEILQRPEFEWQKWNEGMGARPPVAEGDITGGAGLLGMLWNAPGMVANLQRKVAEGGAKALIGRDVNLGRAKYTDPLESGRLRNAGATVSRLLQSVMPAGLDQAEAMLQPNPLSSGPPDVKPKLEHLMQLVTPQVSGMTPSSDVFGNLTPDQGAPPFEYEEGYPSAMPPRLDVLSRIRALRGLPATLQ